jgi:hypothetical protein
MGSLSPLVGWYCGRGQALREFVQPLFELTLRGLYCCQPRMPPPGGTCAVLPTELEAILKAYLLKHTLCPAGMATYCR